MQKFEVAVVVIAQERSAGQGVLCWALLLDSAAAIAHMTSAAQAVHSHILVPYRRISFSVLHSAYAQTHLAAYS